MTDQQQAPAQTRQLEKRLGAWLRGKLPPSLAEFVLFVVKQGWAALFGGLLLAAIILSSLIWQENWTLHRYDALFLFAVTTQIAMLWFKLETWEEAKVIVLFHLTGTAMELFKTHMGSWSYPEEAFFRLGGVPLFSGFMYAAVGSFQARVMRIFDMRFAPYPPFWLTLLLAIAIYVNFFAHHFLPDIRLALFAATLLLFAKTHLWFFVDQKAYWMPMPLAAFLAACALYVAENVGTLTGTWLYAGQTSWELVSPSKLGSWYLLLYVSFVTVTVVIRNPLLPRAIHPTSRTDIT